MLAQSGNGLEALFVLKNLYAFSEGQVGVLRETEVTVGFVNEFQALHCRCRLVVEAEQAG